MYKKCTLMLFSTVGALALSATAAMAAWQSYGNTNPITSSSSTWKCQSSIKVATNVNSQVCTVRSANGQYVQGAVIIRNNNSYLYTANASMTVYYPNRSTRGSWSCSSSGVGANSWSVCFGTTFAANGYSYYTGGYANNVWLGTTGYN